MTASWIRSGSRTAEWALSMVGGFVAMALGGAFTGACGDDAVGSDAGGDGAGAFVRDAGAMRDGAGSAEDGGRDSGGAGGDGGGAPSDGSAAVDGAAAADAAVGADGGGGGGGGGGGDGGMPAAFACPNEPSGMRRASEIVFDGTLLPTGTTYLTSGYGIRAGGWMRSSTAPVASITSAADAPVDPPSVYTIHFAPGHRFGNGGGTLQGWEGDPADRESRSRHSYEEYYECGWIRLRGDAAAPTEIEVGGNGWKVFGYWGAGCGSASELPTTLIGWGDTGMAVADGTLVDRLGLTFRTQGCVSQVGTTMPAGSGVNRNFSWNRPGARTLVTVGAWHRYEVYFRANTVGADDGILRAWVDGTPSEDYANARWRDATHARGFFGRHYNPVYNGGTSATPTLSHHTYLDIAGIYISLRGMID